MKWNRLMVVCLLAAVLAVGCAPAKVPPTAQVPAEYRNIRIPGGSIGGVANTAVMALTAVLNKYYPDIQWSSSSGSSGTTAVYITKGSIKMGHTAHSAYIDAYGYDKVKESRLRSVTAHQPPLQYLWVIPEDKPWKDFTEVPKGATVISGSPASTMLPISDAWLKIAGLNSKDYNYFPLGRGELADAWRTGKVDAALLAVGGMSPYLMDMAISGRKFKVMGLSPEQVARAKSDNMLERLGIDPPAMSNVTQLVPEVFKQDVMSLQAQMLVASRDDFPDDIAYRMAKVIEEHRAELAQIYPAMKHVTVQNHINASRPPFDMHPAVAKYYREKGYLK